MIVKPKIRGFICTTAHPVGCAENVREQIEYVKSQPHFNGAKKVLVIGASMGYGLATRIAASFGSGAATIGVIFDKQGGGARTGSAGWYNTASFERFAHSEGLYAKTINGDAFSADVKKQVIELIKSDLGQIDLLVYSLAAPRRTDTDGTVYTSVLKTTGEAYTNKTIDLKDMKISNVTVEPANEEEIKATVKVMGGEDWIEWIKELEAAGVLAKNAVTTAYSYIGPSLTHPMYKDGSIGRAKADLAASAKKITSDFDGVKAYVSVNKALVTQSSSAIPIVPLYISVLYKIMKQHGCHEGCIEQMYRLYADKVYSAGGAKTDKDGLIRMDDLELQSGIQNEVTKIWEKINDSNITENADIEGYTKDFEKLFGFGFENVDYEAETEIDEKIESIN